MDRYIALVLSPVGRVPFIGGTMTPEREKEVTRAAAFRSMPSFGLEPVEENLSRYYQLVREALV